MPLCNCHLAITLFSGIRGHGCHAQVGSVGKPFNVSLQEGLGAPLRLWSFEDPHLYDLDVTLLPETPQVHAAC